MKSGLESRLRKLEELAGDRGAVFVRAILPGGALKPLAPGVRCSLFAFAVPITDAYQDAQEDFHDWPRIIVGGPD